MSFALQKEHQEQTTTTGSNNNDKRQLIYPTKHIKWNVQVVSLVPSSVFNVLEQSQQSISSPSSCAIDCGYITNDCSWKSFITSTGYVYVWPVCTSTLRQELYPSKFQHLLYIPSSSSRITAEIDSSGPNNNNSRKMLVAMSNAINPPTKTSTSNTTIQSPGNNAFGSSSSSFVYVYATNPDGLVYMWKLSSSSSSDNQEEELATLANTDDNERNKVTCQPNAKLDLKQYMYVGETITSICSFPLVIGTSYGRLFYCTQTVRPIMIISQLMEPYNKERTRSSTNAGSESSLYGLVSWMTPSKKKSSTKKRLDNTRSPRHHGGGGSHEQMVYDGEDEDAIHTILCVESSSSALSSSSLLSITNSGIIEYWEIHSTVGDSHKSKFNMVPITSLKEVIQEHIEQQQSENNGLLRTGMVGTIQDINVLRCTISSPTSSSSSSSSSSSCCYGINTIVRVVCDDDNGNNNSSTRLYWLQGEIQSEDEGNNSIQAPNSIHFSLNDIIWINRFHSTDNVSCIGLCTTNENITYGAFQYDDANEQQQQQQTTTYPVIVMALIDNTNILYEVDLPTFQVPKLVHGMFGRDIITHGFVTLSTLGLGLRGYYTGDIGQSMPEEDDGGTSNKRRRLQGSPIAASSASSASIATLTSHLRSVFWAWYQHSYQQQQQQQHEGGGSIIASMPTLPPSITSASFNDLEPAIIATALQLQHEGEGQQGSSSSSGGGDITMFPSSSSSPSSTFSNPMEWHIAFIDLLQRGGLYRSISLPGRFKLLGIGQELAVYQRLITLRQQQQQDLASKDNLQLLLQELDHIKPYDIVDWLQNIQDRVLSEYNINTTDNSATLPDNSVSVVSDETNLWSSWLSTVLETATLYRQDQCINIYDLPSASRSASSSASSAPTVLLQLWTCNSTLQSIMMKQLNYWNDLTDNDQTYDINPLWLETVVKVALISYMETSKGDGVHDSDIDEREEQYDVIKKLGIPLIQQRLDNGSAVAFELSVDHHWFYGICQIALENESYKDFELESILANVDHLMNDPNAVDYDTKLSFPQYVLRWHADRKLYAHVLKLGKLCPSDVLSSILQGDDFLSRYQWISSIQNGQYENAAHFLLSNTQRLPPSSLEGAAEGSNTVNTSNLKSVQWELSLAKLSNKLAQTTTKGSSMSASVSQRQKAITNKLELAQAQEMLSERTGMKALKGGILSPDRLLTIAMDQLDNTVQSRNELIDNIGSSSADAAIQFCLIGLAICRSVEDSNTRMRMASQVWSKCLLVDIRTFMDLATTQDQTTSIYDIRHTIIQKTIFGQVLEQYNTNTTSNKTEEDTDDDVAYNFRIENDVISRLGLDSHESNKEMKRILRIGVEES